MSLSPIILRRFLLLGCISILAAVPAMADSILDNGSFEYGLYGGNANFETLPAGSTAITGWTITSGSVDWIQGYWQPHHGAYSLDMNGYYAAGTIMQVDMQTVVGQSYLVSFWMSGNPDNLPNIKTLRVDVGGQSFTFTYDMNEFHPSHANMNWRERTLTFEAASNLTAIQFSAINDAGGAFGPALDDISVTAVPEPASLLLLGTGLSVLGMATRRLWRKSMRRAIALSSFLMLGLIFLPQGLRADPIEIYGTGQPSLANGVIDPHYVYGFNTVTPTPGVQAPVVLDPDPAHWPISPAGPWIANTDTSSWIGPGLNFAQSTPGNPVGWYVYTTTFHINGPSAILTGRWSSDNGSTIWLNGMNTGYTVGATAFTAWHNFTITSGFVQGENTLEFRVHNDYLNNDPNNSGNPTGLRVEVSGVVPEPATLLLLGTGLAVIGLAARSRRR